MTGTAIDQEVGYHVGAVGDVNDDGVPDVGVGAPGWDRFSFPVKLNAGRVTLYSGGCPGFVNYCTPGKSASGCNARISGSGTPSGLAPSGFTLSATQVEGDKSALFFFGWNGPQANSWGNGTSYQCVVPPVKRGGVLVKNGTAGKCRRSCGTATRATPRTRRRRSRTRSSSSCATDRGRCEMSLRPRRARSPAVTHARSPK